jgi:hypothetical protein
MRVPKRNLRQEYRLKQREQIEASALMTKEYPLLKMLKVTLEYFDPAGLTKNGEMKCKLNVEHAKAVLWFACQEMECTGGDFDLSHPVAQAVAGKKKLVAGELRCAGTRKRGDRELVPCRTLLRYTLNLKYD